MDHSPEQPSHPPFLFCTMSQLMQSSSKPRHHLLPVCLHRAHHEYHLHEQGGRWVSQEMFYKRYIQSQVMYAIKRHPGCRRYSLSPSKHQHYLSPVSPLVLKGVVGGLSVEHLKPISTLDHYF